VSQVWEDTETDVESCVIQDMKIGDITIFGRVIFINYELQFVQFQDVKTHCFYSKEFKEIENSEFYYMQEEEAECIH